MYDLERVIERMKTELQNSRLPFTLKVSKYDMTNLKNDYYESLIKSLFQNLDEDDRLIYFILVLQDILKLELAIKVSDIDKLHEETIEIFETLVIENMAKN